MVNTLLSVEQVSLKFGGLQALRDVSFQVPEGGAVALIGPNGAGKTTCFNVISGFQRDATGRIVFAEHDITSMRPHKRAGVGRTFQRVELGHGVTVLDSVLLGLHRSAWGGFAACALSLFPATRSERAMRNLAHESIETWGLKGLAGRSVDSLPLGHQRLVELARAEISRPRLLMLDEVASGLSLAEVQLVTEHLRLTHQRGTALLLVEHNMSFVADLVSDVVVLNFGSVLFRGPAQEAMRDESVISAYLGGVDGDA